MIYLLDLNYTLVANSNEKHKPFTRQIELEHYRLDLIEKIAGNTVILITARPDMHKEATLRSIADKCNGWRPEKAYFNDKRLFPAAIKKSILDRFIFPAYDDAVFFGIESNPQTRAMYANNGIQSAPYDKFMAQ